MYIISFTIFFFIEVKERRNSHSSNVNGNLSMSGEKTSYNVKTNITSFYDVVKMYAFSILRHRKKDAHCQMDNLFQTCRRKWNTGTDERGLEINDMQLSFDFFFLFFFIFMFQACAQLLLTYTSFSFLLVLSCAFIGCTSFEHMVFRRAKLRTYRPLYTMSLQAMVYLL